MRQVLAILVLLCISPQFAAAIPINTNVALPVGKGDTVVRVQTKATKPQNGKADFTVPIAAAYGITEKTALIVVFPIRISPMDEGIGDLPLTLRYTIYQYDAPFLTSRFGLLGGIKLPIGSEPFTSDSVDWRLGGVYTIQSDRHEFDASVVYSINTEANQIERGDQVFHDLAYQLRLFPWIYPDSGVPSQVNLDIELNGVYADRTDINGSSNPDSGGYRLYLSPGIQWVSKYVILEASVQIPVVQDLNGSQLKEDFRVVGGLRFHIP